MIFFTLIYLSYFWQFIILWYIQIIYGDNRGNSQTFSFAQNYFIHVIDTTVKYSMV